jgi:hypothetical protein
MGEPEGRQDRCGKSRPHGDTFYFIVLSPSLLLSLLSLRDPFVPIFLCLLLFSVL